MRILAYTPTWGNGPRPETLRSMERQIFGGELVHEVSYENPFPPPDPRNYAPQYRRARKLALDGGFDALLTVEHDMSLPADTVERLWQTKADVVYGLYMLRHGALVLNAWAYEGDRNLGESLSLSKYGKERRRAAAAGRVRVSGAGFGCTLIRRHVLERIVFQDVAPNAPDIPFAQDCLHAGYVSVARFDAPCGHWCPKRMEWLWPGKRGDLVQIKIRIQKDLVTLIDGETTRLRAGQEIEIGEQDAEDLLRAGYAIRPIEMAVMPQHERAVGKRERG